LVADDEVDVVDASVDERIENVFENRARSGRGASVSPGLPSGGEAVLPRQRPTRLLSAGGWRMKMMYVAFGQWYLR